MEMGTKEFIMRQKSHVRYPLTEFISKGNTYILLKHIQPELSCYQVVIQLLNITPAQSQRLRLWNKIYNQRSLESPKPPR
jgi:hypothetical protein